MKATVSSLPQGYPEVQQKQRVQSAAHLADCAVLNPCKGKTAAEFYSLSL